MPAENRPRPVSGEGISTLLAWFAHLYTALGLLAAAGMAVLLVLGNDEDTVRRVFRLMALATFIDATDGWLARRLEVEKRLPGFDGRRLDDIIDFQTYTALPLLLIWRAGLMPAEQGWWLLLPLLASAYGFSQKEVKTGDGYFLGFPSYWNVVSFYLYHLRFSADVTVGILAVLALLTFVPSRYFYPSQKGLLNRIALLLGIPWGLAILLILLPLPGNAQPLVLASLVFPAHYLAASWLMELHRFLRRKPEPLP